MKRISALTLSILFLFVMLLGCSRVPAGGTAPKGAPAAAAEAPVSGKPAITEAPAAEEPSAEEPVAEEPVTEAPAVSDAVFALSYSDTYVTPIQDTKYTAGDGYIFGILKIDAPAGYGLTTKDGAELRFSDGTALTATISSMSTESDGTVTYYELIFAVPQDIMETVESLYIDGQLFLVTAEG